VGRNRPFFQGAERPHRRSSRPSGSTRTEWGRSRGSWESPWALRSPEAPRQERVREVGGAAGWRRASGEGGNQWCGPTQEGEGLLRVGLHVLRV